MYIVKFKKEAQKFITKHKKEGIKFYKAFCEIAQDRYNFKKYDIKKYYDSEKNSFRLRIGKYRSTFQIIDEELVILVIDIDSRGDIYK